jgi:hypothetical protein
VKISKLSLRFRVLSMDRTFWKQKSPIDLDQAEVNAVLSSLVWADGSQLKPLTMTVFSVTIRSRAFRRHSA